MHTQEKQLTDLNHLENHLNNLNDLLEAVDPHQPAKAKSFRPVLPYLDVEEIVHKTPRAKIAPADGPNQINLLLTSPAANHFRNTVKPQFNQSSRQSRDFSSFSLPQANQANQTRTPRLATIIGALAPTITSFMGKLLRPLISDIAHRPGVSKYKDNLLQRFLPRALKGTQLADTQMERALESSLIQRKYSVALNTLKSQEKDLDTSSYLPQGDLASDSFVHQDSGIMQKNTR